MSIKHLFYAVTVLALAGVLAVAGLYSPPAADAGQDQEAQTITVRATGTIETAPDTGYIQLGVHTRADSAEQAVEKNSDEMKAVIDAMIDAGIDESDLSTSRFSVSPVYEQRDREERQLVGFQVQNTVEAAIRDIEHIGHVIDAAVSAGANTVDNINLQVSDRESLEDEAIQLAVQRAREKAEVAGAEAGQSIVGVSSMQVIDEVVGIPRMRMEDAAYGEVPIMPGQISVSSTVQMIFEIR